MQLNDQDKMEGETLMEGEQIKQNGGNNSIRILKSN